MAIAKRTTLILYNGNLKTRKENGEEVHYIWDDQNRLVEVQTPNETINYIYDDDNIRVSSTVDDVTTSYLLDKNRPYAQVLAEYTNGNLDASYLYGLDLISQERGNTDSYYLVDGLGSTRGLTDSTGDVTDVYYYDAYGNLTDSVGNSENSYLFAGEQFDSNLDQYYLRQRYYDPSVGCFTRRDTYSGKINKPITLNKYIYANANPINGIDPSGFFTLTNVLGGINISNSLAAQTFTTVLNPVAISFVQVWAMIAVGTVSLFLIEEKNKQDELTGLSIVPDEEDNRQKVAEDERQANQMRLQLQGQEKNQTFGIPIKNIPEVGVTVEQVNQALTALWHYRRSLASWFPKKHDPALLKGIDGVRKKAESARPLGVFEGNSQVYSRQWKKSDPKGNRPVKRGDYRVDFENQRGHNLRF